MNIEQMAQDCLETLAGLDTFDVDLRDHPKAWEAIERFAALVRAQALEEAAVACESAWHFDGNFFSGRVRALKASPDAEGK